MCEDSLRSAWAEVISVGAINIGYCGPGAHRAMSAVDLLICATAAVQGLVVLHDDKDFATAADHLTDLTERRVHDTPPQDLGLPMP
jgi:predicted nucleic acid-binding protein